MSIFKRGNPDPIEDFYGKRIAGVKVHKMVPGVGVHSPHAVCLNGAYHIWYTEKDSEVTCRACLHVMAGGKPGEVSP